MDESEVKLLKDKLKETRAALTRFDKALDDGRSYYALVAHSDDASKSLDSICSVASHIYARFTEQQWKPSANYDGTGL